MAKWNKISVESGKNQQQAAAKVKLLKRTGGFWFNSMEISRKSEEIKAKIVEVRVGKKVSQKKRERRNE